MKYLCIYHKIDLDGWSSASIVKLYCKQNNIKLSLLGYNYNDKINKDIFKKYDKIVITDITLDSELMLELSKQNKLIWIDHHKSAMTDSIKYGYNKCEGLQNDKYAACELTWKFFYKNNIPYIITLLGLYDSFRSKGKSIHENIVLPFQYGMRAIVNCHKNFPIEQLLNNDKKFINKIKQSGDSILKYLKTEALYKFKNNKIVTELDNHKAICFNIDRFNPINFDIDYSKDYDIAISFSFFNDKWNVSIYNDNDKVDCSEIAKKYGGGGHKGAAGFRCDKLPFKLK